MVNSCDFIRHSLFKFHYSTRKEPSADPAKEMFPWHGACVFSPNLPVFTFPAPTIPETSDGASKTKKQEQYKTESNFCHPLTLGLRLAADPSAGRGNVYSQFSSQAVPPIQSFLLEVIDLAIQVADDVLGGLDGGLAVSLALPSLDAVNLLLAAAQFGCDLVTDSAVLGAVLVAVHDELHTAGLTGAVLLGAVLAEGAPLVVAAAVKGLVKEAHFEMVELRLKRQYVRQEE